MEALRVIPQVFFDLIARVVPGAVALFVVGLAVPGAWAKLMVQIALGPQVVQDSAALWILTLLVGSYSIGHILSPVGKVLGRMFPAHEVIRQLFESDEPTPQAQFVRQELGSTYKKQHEQSIWIWYDWLRVFVPGAGELTARIRAEYTMYSSFTVVFTAGFLIRVPYATATIGDATFLGVMIGLAILMAFRYHQMERTFRHSVTNFYFVSRGAFDSHWKASSISDA